MLLLWWSHCSNIQKCTLSHTRFPPFLYFNHFLRSLCAHTHVHTKTHVHTHRSFILNGASSPRHRIHERMTCPFFFGIEGSFSLPIHPYLYLNIYFHVYLCTHTNVAVFSLPSTGWISMECFFFSLLNLTLGLSKVTSLNLIAPHFLFFLSYPFFLHTPLLPLSHKHTHTPVFFFTLSCGFNSLISSSGSANGCC